MMRYSLSFVKYALASLLLLATFHGKAQSTLEKDKLQINQIRTATNKAIKEYDLAAETKYYLDDYVIALGSGGVITGKQNYIKRYTGDTIGYYIRTTQNIKINSNGKVAIENGQWVFIHYCVQQLGGDYTAQWRKIAGEWKIQAEVYVQLWDKKRN